MSYENPLIKITHIVPSLNTGGVQKYILSLNKFDSSHGIIRQIISIISEGGNIKDEFFNSGIECKFCPVIFPDKNLRPYRLFKKLRQLTAFSFPFRLYKLINDCDSDIICSDDGTQVLTQALVSLYAKKKFIWYIHTEKLVINKCNLIIISLLLKMKSFVIIAVSNSAAKANLGYLMKNHQIPNNKLFIIPPGRNLEPIIIEINNREKNRKLYGAINDQILIGSIGRLHDSKGFDLLIRAMEIILNKTSKNFKLFIAGDGPKKKELLSLIDELKLFQYITLLGNITNIPQFLSSLDIYIQPSIYEGFSITLLEAMSAGLPILASDTDGLKETMENNKTGMLFKNNNLDSLTNSVIQMIESPLIEKEGMIKNANFTIQQYPMNKTYNRILKVYQDLMYNPY